MNVVKALRFFAVAEAMEGMSKDPSTKVGCAIIDDDFNVLSLGFNGFPRKVDDSITNFPERYERPLKYALTIHGELNAICNAARKGTSLKDSTLIVTSLFPCSNCSGAIIQSGIKRIITSLPNNERWIEDAEISKLLFKESGIEVIYASKSEYGIWVPNP